MKKMKLQGIVLPILFLGILALLESCASTPKVERNAVHTTIDLSGRWNDADSRMVSEEMIRDCLDRPWLERFKMRNEGKIPTVIVGTVRNRSHEHINVQTFVKDLEKALINFGKVQFVASKLERRKLKTNQKNEKEMVG
jgi:hypothetical protein